MELKAERLEELGLVAEEVVKSANQKRIILLNGEMGVGKTTLIKEICLKLGVEENVSSPTFGIVNEYKGKETTIYHFDAYRIEDEEEAYDIGIEDYLYSGHWCLIEWPDKIENVLPSSNELMEVNISEKNGLRTYKII